MSTPLTLATTGSDADPLDEADGAGEDDSCEQPASMGSTSSARTAIAEMAVRPERAGFDGIMVQSLQIIQAPPTAERAGQSRNHHPFAMAAKGHEFEKNVKKLAD
jgi:hypothetical protein